MTDDLRERNERAAAAMKAAGSREVYVFGSAAFGELRDESDVDIAVAGLPPGRYLEAMGKASRVLHRPVDLVDLDEEGPFTAYLNQEGEMLRVA